MRHLQPAIVTKHGESGHRPDAATARGAAVDTESDDDQGEGVGAELNPSDVPSITDLSARLRRISAALGRIRVTDLAQFPARVFNTPRAYGFFQDFRGGASREDMTNDVFSLIANVACLRDHLKKWAQDNGRHAEKVDETIRSSPDLCIIMDLWNSDKHVGSARGGGWSKRSPRLDGVDRALTLRPQPKKGSWAAVQQGRDGRLRPSGDGTVTVDTSGTVLDGTGKVIDNLQAIVMRAVDAWERLLVTYEIGRGLSLN